MDNINFVEVDSTNYKKALELQQQLFPYEDGDIDILESVKKSSKIYNFIKYFLVKFKNKYVGFTGIYSYDIYPEDAWLGWSGFLPDFDTDELNDLSLNHVKNYAKDKGYKALRVYTDEIADEKDNKDYIRFGMTSEEYTLEKNKFYEVGKTLIYSISLGNNKLEKWNNKNLFLQAHEKRNLDNDKKPSQSLDLAKVTYVPVSRENVKNAIKIQQTIFPLESGKQDILESLEQEKNNFAYLQYYLIRYQEKFIGIAGLYSYKEYPCDAWLGWFGILPDYRRKHIGSNAIDFLKATAKKLKFKNLRVYTDSYSNYYACKLYSKHFEKKEEYTNESGKYYQVGKTLIYSTSLTDKEVSLWDNKNIFLEKHEKTNNVYELKFVPLNKRNLKTASLVQYEIFNESHSCGYLDYLDEVENRKKRLLPLDFLVYYKKKPVGVIGLYEIDGYPDDIWLNWFGVLPKYRKLGFGTQMLLHVLQLSKSMGRKNFRLFTYAVWHYRAQGIYKRTMPLEELYTNKDDNQYCIKEGIPKIFSISLNGKTITKWKNKYIDLFSESSLHIKSVKRMVKDGLFDNYKKKK